MFKDYTFVLVYLLSSIKGVKSQDLCPGNTWVRHGLSCYLFVKHVSNDWTESEYFCSVLYSKLVEIETPAENTFLKKMALSEDDNEDFGFWIGGIDVIYEGHWIWAKSKKPFNYTDWGSGFPDDYQSNEDCAHLFKDRNYQWNDERCDHRMSFICEYELDLDPLTIIG